MFYVAGLVLTITAAALLGFSVMAVIWLGLLGGAAIWLQIRLST